MSGAEIGLGISILLFVAAIAGFAFRLGRRFTHVEDALHNLDRDVMELVTVPVRLERIVTQFEAISALIGAHMEAQGHTGTMLRVERLAERLKALQDDVNQIERFK